MQHDVLTRPKACHWMQLHYLALSNEVLEQVNQRRRRPVRVQGQLMLSCLLGCHQLAEQSERQANLRIAKP